MRGLASTLAILSFSLLGLAACGGNVVGGTGAAGTGGTGATGTGATGTTFPSGDCTTDAQCNGGKCVELTPGGYKVCAHLPPEATTCMQKPQDQCCTSADCTGGAKCYSNTTLGYCGGPAMLTYNQCMTDQCKVDSDCLGGGADAQVMCIPAGAFGYPVRSCFLAYCHTSADCTAHPGGVCAPVADPCCGGPSGMACVYPGGCTKESDCPQGGACQIDPQTGIAACISGPVGCPV